MVYYLFICLIEFLAECFMIRTKRIKKYWNVFLGINVASYLMIPASSSIVKIQWALTDTVLDSILIPLEVVGYSAMFIILLVPGFLNLLLLPLAIINKKQQEVKTDWKLFAISLAATFAINLAAAILLISGY